MLCDKCRASDRHTLAQYILLADSEDLAGLNLEKADEENRAILRWPRLCRPHHAQLPEDARMAYVPTADACPEI
jgi:hypothetical protein